MENGASADIAVVGNEISWEVPRSWAANRRRAGSRYRTLASALRLGSQVIKDEFNRAPVVHLSLRHTQALITQTAQTAVCSRYHSLDQQLCRWLLLSLDRLRGSELVITQALIGNARRTPRWRHRTRAQAAQGRPHQAFATPRHDHRPPWAGEAKLRVL
jgi:hypothetical protein